VAGLFGECGGGGGNTCKMWKEKKMMNFRVRVYLALIPCGEIETLELDCIE